MGTGQTAPSNHVRVLVVDDDPSIRSLVRDVLQEAGLRTSEATDGKTALELLAGDDQPTVVLLDQYMLQLSGVEVADAIAQNESLARRCTCILLTGSADGLSLLTDLPILSKPFELDTLVDAVSAAVDQLARRSLSGCMDGQTTMRT